jgi:hypothetical protein
MQIETMHQITNQVIRARKAGAEDIILMRLPSDRFRNLIPPHYDPPVDERSRYQVALVAQSCENNSYDCHGIGPTDEFHLWLKIAPTDSGEIVKGNINRLPSQQWLSLASASGNLVARDYLQSFGFSPLILNKVSLQETSGAVIFQDHEEIDWTINGPGRGLARVDVDHLLKVEADGPDIPGHQIAASISDAMMDQMGRVHIKTKAFEPFLHMGECFAAIIHRMSGLEANITWRLHPHLGN